MVIKIVVTNKNRVKNAVEAYFISLIVLRIVLNKNTSITIKATKKSTEKNSRNDLLGYVLFVSEHQSEVFYQ